jgi:CHRD domain
VTKRRVLIAVAAAMAVTVGGVTAAASSAAGGGGGGNRMRASLTGFEEVAAVSTTGNGSFSAREISDGVFQYTLTYSGLESDVTQSHIHFGQKDVNGGIAVFLCTNLGNGPAGTPACPGPRSGTVTGTFTAASVGAGAAAQGITAGELDELLVAIKSGLGYCNLHSSAFPSGEARGQIRGNRGGDD